MNRYASHLPVLKALARMVPMRSVLEFGAGEHSTPFFLSLKELTRLVSVEVDPAWRRKVASTDERHTVVEEPLPAEDFDLIFIDDGTEAAEREQTIRAVLTQPHPVVAIHDAEVGAYAATIRELAPRRATFVCVSEPHTAVIWPGKSRSGEFIRAYQEAS